MRAAILAFSLLLSMSVKGSEYQYISNIELKEEIKERSRDIQRTTKRIAEITTLEASIRAVLSTAKEDGKRIEAVASSRARLYYRFIKQGGTLKYLFASNSVMDMLKRAFFLKRLLTEGLESRREAGLRIAAAEKQLETIQAEKTAALEMHAMLTKAYAELQIEMKRRCPRKTF